MKGYKNTLKDIEDHNKFHIKNRITIYNEFQQW